MDKFFAKVKVVLTAVPTWGAVAVGFLTFVSTQVVPNLPADQGQRVAGWVASAVAAVASVVAVVRRVTPSGDVGLLPKDEGFWEH